MMKRIVALMLALSIFSVQANTGSNNSLKAAFDELNYSLAAWDQKDRAEYDKITNNFQSKIEELQNAGVTQAEIMEFATSQVKDQNLAAELSLAYTQINLNKLSQNEARKLILDTFSKGYSRGANWSGDAVLYGAIVVVIVAAIIVAAASGGSVYVDAGPSCYDQYNCYDYYDSWGFYLYTDCYYETYCY
jgi:hypothetical protein